MKYDKDRIISDFNLTPFGTQGWMTNKSMECPFCGKSGKWGLTIVGNVHVRLAYMSF